jgi:hypothetical protein
MEALVGDAILFSALSMAWGWIVWKRLIANPVLRNAVSVTSGWGTGVTIIKIGLMAVAVTVVPFTWHVIGFFLTSYVPVLFAAVLLGIYQRRKKLASEPKPYSEIFR